MNSPQLNPGAAGVPPFRPISASLDRYYIRRPRVYLIAIIVAYLVAATLFALATPPWQNPDEPAHYNNIAHIAGGDGLPVLRMGDYDQVYQGQLLESRFPLTMTVAPLRYESYQPPLYYLAAAPIFLVTNGSLLALRLFNVLLGAVALVLLYACLELVFPTKPLLSVGATAFAALLPMHVAMSAAVNNDGLAELLLVAALLVLLKWMHAQFYARGEGRGLTHRVVRSPGHLIILGVLLGLGLETKIYAYVVLPLCAGVVLLVEWLQPRVHSEHQPQRLPSWSTFWRGVGATLWIVVPAVLIGLPLWIRNVLLYGAWDFLGLRWHDTVVAGQPTTAAWIARYGWLDYLGTWAELHVPQFLGGVWLAGCLYGQPHLHDFAGLFRHSLLRPAVGARALHLWPARNRYGPLSVLGVGIVCADAPVRLCQLRLVQHQVRSASGTVFLLGPAADQCLCRVELA